MKIKIQLAAISVIMVVFSAQIMSCSKDGSAVTNTNSTATTDNSNERTLSNNLVALYTFNGDVLDHSGNNNNVVFNNATPTSGKKGEPNTAYYFDGSTYMTVANSSSLNPTQGITLAARIKPTGFYQGLCHSNRFISKGYNDYDPGRYVLGYDDMAFYNYHGCSDDVQENYENFYGTYGDGQATAAGGTSKSYIKVNSWYSVVLTYDGKTSNLYVNGALKNSASKSTTFTPNTRSLFIGRHEDPNFPYYFTGIIDEIKIYNKALSSSEVQKLFTLN